MELTRMAYLFSVVRYLDTRIQKRFHNLPAATIGKVLGAFYHQTVGLLPPRPPRPTIHQSFRNPPQTARARSKYGTVFLQTMSPLGRGVQCRYRTQG